MVVVVGQLIFLNFLNFCAVSFENVVVDCQFFVMYLRLPPPISQRLYETDLDGDPLQSK